jgi:hypothetical protein
MELRHHAALDGLQLIDPKSREGLSLDDRFGIARAIPFMSLNVI